MQPFEITVPAAPRAPELLLSVPTHADVDRITEICQDPAIQEWTTVPSPYTRDSALGFVTDVVEPGWQEGRELTWAIRETIGTGPVLVGMIGIVVSQAGRNELGYWVAPQARGRGVASRAARAVVELALDPDGPLALPSVTWACLIDDGVPNWASWRIAWSLGFLREGRRRAVYRRGGKVFDEWTATLLAGEPMEPRGPWDGPRPASKAPVGRGNGSAHTDGDATPLVAHDGVGQREGDDPEALVRRFHHVYGLPVRTDGPSLERESLHMRMDLVAEEFAELVGAVYGARARSAVEQSWRQARRADDGARDTVGAADALADLVYVVYGMALETGIDLAAVLAEVQRSNMSKLGADGRPVYRQDGKVLKGPGYRPPDVAAVLARGGLGTATG